MNTNSTTIDSSSFFTYNEAVDFINGLNHCNTDGDCPADSFCISNTCIVNFFCNNEDKCAFYETLCDGKPCKKESSCNTNSDCLSNECNTDDGDIKECRKSYDYTSGLFTFDDGLNFFKKTDECSKDIDCPIPSSCIEGDCVASFYCKEEDKTICAFNEYIQNGISSHYNGRQCKLNEDCLSGACTNGTCNRTNYALVSRNTELFGLYEGEKCSSNNQCYSNYCHDGECGRPQNLASFGYIIILMWILIFTVVVFGFVMVVLCFCKPSISKRKNENQKNQLPI